MRVVFFLFLLAEATPSAGVIETEISVDAAFTFVCLDFR